MNRKVESASVVQHQTSSPYLRSSVTVSRMMFDVVLGLLPGYAIYVVFFGWGLLIQASLAIATALACEAAVARVRKRPVKLVLGDGSAIVTAMLLALGVPSIAPWWVIVVGTIFAIIMVKQIYGGLGHNLFNPAMGGYVMLMISFPVEMTRWQLPLALLESAPDFSATLGYIFGSASEIDAISGATTLDALKTGLSMMKTAAEIRGSGVFGSFAGFGWEWISTGFAAGGVWLLWRRVITWHIPVAVLGSLFVFALLVYVGDPDASGSPVLHLFSGAIMVGAFFIATDPAGAPGTVKGKLLFGAGVGILAYIIRVWGGYPDGIAFAVLLMNAAAPTIEYYTRARVFGH